MFLRRRLLQRPSGSDFHSLSYRSQEVIVVCQDIDESAAPKVAGSNSRWRPDFNAMSVIIRVASGIRVLKDRKTPICCARIRVFNVRQYREATFSDLSRFQIASAAAAVSLSIKRGEKLNLTSSGTPGTDWTAAFSELMSGCDARNSSNEAWRLESRLSAKRCRPYPSAC